MKKKLWIIPIVIIISVLLLIVVVLGMSKLFGRESRYEIEKDLMEKGPWSTEAIWMDKNSQMYLICTKDSGNQYANVVAYLYVDGQWCSTQVDLYQGAPIACFVASDGERVLEASAQMNGQNLRLYKFKVYDDAFALEYDDIELSQFAYQEQIDKLPFDIMK